MLLKILRLPHSEMKISARTFHNRIHRSRRREASNFIQQNKAIHACTYSYTPSSCPSPTPYTTTAYSSSTRHYSSTTKAPSPGNQDTPYPIDHDINPTFSLCPKTLSSQELQTRLNPTSVQLFRILLQRLRQCASSSSSSLSYDAPIVLQPPINKADYGVARMLTSKESIYYATNKNTTSGSTSNPTSSSEITPTDKEMETTDEIHSFLDYWSEDVDSTSDGYDDDGFRIVGLDEDDDDDDDDDGNNVERRGHDIWQTRTLLLSYRDIYHAIVHGFPRVSFTSPNDTDTNTTTSSDASAGCSSETSSTTGGGQDMIESILKVAGIDSNQLQEEVMKSIPAGRDGEMPSSTSTSTSNSTKSMTELVQEMMNTPEFEQHMNDPELIEEGRQMICNNPAMKQIMCSSMPGFDEILNDPIKWREGCLSGMNLYKSMGKDLVNALGNPGVITKSDILNYHKQAIDALKIFEAQYLSWLCTSVTTTVHTMDDSTNSSALEEDGDENHGNNPDSLPRKCQIRIIATSTCIGVVRPVSTNTIPSANTAAEAAALLAAHNIHVPDDQGRIGAGSGSDGRGGRIGGRSRRKDEETKYRFAYRIRVENMKVEGEHTASVQLLGRTWNIAEDPQPKKQEDSLASSILQSIQAQTESSSATYDDDDESESGEEPKVVSVDAPTTGAVGHLPVIHPGQAFEYISGCEIHSPTGKMDGCFHMAMVPWDTPSAHVGDLVKALDGTGGGDGGGFHFKADIDPFVLKADP